MKTITNFSALVTLIGFLYPFFGKDRNEFTYWQITFLIALILILIFMIIWELCSRPKVYKTNSAINDYMYNWINHAGRTLIFTRDMSWAKGSEIQALLESKAENSNLILCMPKRTEQAIKLEQKGAEIIEYSRLKYRPKSRFTMIRYGKTDTKMAIGIRDNKGHHRIEEVQNGIHTEYHLAEDLFEILKEISHNE